MTTLKRGAFAGLLGVKYQKVNEDLNARVEWKSSIICTVYKKGSKSGVANYRPIYLTPVAC